MKLTGLLLAMGALALLLVAQPASTARSDVTFTDPTGDAQGAAPDVTNVVVGNQRNTITLRVEVANQPALNPDSVLLVYFDTDRDPQSGAPNTLGAEYVFFLFVENGQLNYELGRWSNGDFVTTPSASVRGNYDRGLTLSIDRRELGNTEGFSFWVRGAQEVGSAIYIDDAPNDQGTYSYRLTGLAPSVMSMRVLLSPYPARAGRILTGRVVNVLLSTNQRVRPSSVRCSARIGSRSLGNGCRWRIPRNARGTVRVTFTATYRGSSRTTVFTVPIRR